MPEAVPVYLPSETRSREFDGKLLLAGLLSARGHPVFVGSRMAMHKRIHLMPRGLYVAKDVNPSSRVMFRILDRLGFSLIAWDEEGVLTIDADTYHKRRVSAENLGRLRAFLAWGAVNRRLIETAPAPRHPPIHVTGNPRIDLLSPRYRDIYRKEAEALIARFGAFILVNSNFGSLNHYLPGAGVTQDATGAFRNTGIGNPDWWSFRSGVLDSFKDMLPRLADAYPDRNIVLRPHPAESPALWSDLVAGRPNVTVLHEGAVYPWLMASAVAVHNGCTTGLESYLLDHPAVSYQAAPFGSFAPALSDVASIPARTFDDLVAALGPILDGAPPPADPAIRAEVERHVGPLDGVGASARIAALIAEKAAGEWAPSRPPLRARAAGFARAALRGAAKTVNGYRPGHKNSNAYTRHRFPDATAAEVSARLEELGALGGGWSGLNVAERGRNVFEIRSRRSA